MYKKLLLLGILIFSITFGVIFGKSSLGEVFAYYKDGEYRNIYGSGYVSCKNPDECNKLYIADNNYCTPDSGTCTGDSKNGVWALKLTCSGNERECGNGIGTVVKPGEWSQSSLAVDKGTACNQTVQIDLFDKKCDANGGWDNDCKLLGYMVWYSGACPADTPAPACNTDCTANPNICQQAKDGCTVCADNASGSGKSCQPPAPACNTDCSGNPNICQQATDGCTVCTDDGSGSKTCQPPLTSPSPSPTNPPGVTSPPRPSNPVPSNPPVNSPSPSAPPTSPTPDFSEAMCQCDGMTVSQIIAGQPAVFTATSKVTGSDVTKAEAKQIEFLLTAGNDPANRQRIAGPERVNTTASGSSTEMKYTAQWTTTIPANVQKGVEYQARATIKCTRKTTAHAYPYTAMVLGESESRGGLFAIIADFFRNLFGGEDKKTNDTIADETQTSVQEDFASIAEQNNIQLGSFVPAKVIENKCPVVKFEFQ